ncbi:MAG: hypothetical protein GY849_16300, partial [Deltaproteobacteria bacterium]|nr:hypothetical protein [Deltaproteobacteria bacterium]
GGYGLGYGLNNGYVRGVDSLARVDGAAGQYGRGGYGYGRRSTGYGPLRDAGYRGEKEVNNDNITMEKKDTDTRGVGLDHLNDHMTGGAYQGHSGYNRNAVARFGKTRREFGDYDGDARGDTDGNHVHTYDELRDDEPYHDRHQDAEKAEDDEGRHYGIYGNVRRMGHEHHDNHGS